MEVRTYIAETCAQRQPIPLKPDNQTIQAQDYSVISLNAHRLTTFGRTLLNALVMPLIVGLIVTWFADWLARKHKK